MKTMRRILVIRSGGAGKSTAARAIAAAAGLPLVHLDRVFWHAGWQPTPDEEWARIVDAWIAEEEWVIDGNYGGTLPSRLARAEAVVFLHVPLLDLLVACDQAGRAAPLTAAGGHRRGLPRPRFVGVRVVDLAVSEDQ